MQSILDWGNDKPVLAAFLARSMAMSADSLVALNDKELRRHGLEAGRPDAARWLKMYFNTKKTYATALAFLCQPQLLILLESTNTYFRSTAAGDDPFDVVEGLSPMFERMLFEGTEDIPDPKQPIEPDTQNLRESLESAFTCLVIMTCLSRFNTLPSVLFRKASKGDVDALISLLSVDLMAMESPRIRAQVYRVFATAKPGTCKRLQRALAGEGGQNRSAGNLKALLSAFVEQVLVDMDGNISKICEQFSKQKLQNFKLNSADLMRALDAAAFTQRGDLKDSHLPNSLEGFQKSVRRAKLELDSVEAEADKKNS